MPTRTRRVARSAAWGGLVVSAVAALAALNAHNTWVAFTIEGGSSGTLVADEVQASFQQWTLVCLASLIISSAAIAILTLGGSRASKAA